MIDSALIDQFIKYFFILIVLCFIVMVVFSICIISSKQYEEKDEYEAQNKAQENYIRDYFKKRKGGKK